VAINRRDAASAGLCIIQPRSGQGMNPTA